MSWPALGWASKQKPGRVADKMVLIALADRHNEESDLSYPSIAWLADFSCLDRKTVVASLGRLEAAGLISDSGVRFGKTKQVKGYRLSLNSTVSGNDTGKGTPKTELLPAKSTDFSEKQYRKRDTEPFLEPEGKEEEANASCASDDAPALKPEHFVEKWNTLAKRLSKPLVRNLTPERRVKLKARIAGYSLEDFREVLGNIERSPFLRGDKDWQGCTFDWVTKKANFQKILEGNYNG